MNDQQKSIAMERFRSIFGLIASVVIAQTTVNLVLTLFATGALLATVQLGLSGLFGTIYLVVAISIGLELAQWFSDNNMTKQH